MRVYGMFVLSPWGSVDAGRFSEDYGSSRGAGHSTDDGRPHENVCPVPGFEHPIFIVVKTAGNRVCSASACSALAIHIVGSGFSAWRAPEMGDERARRQIDGPSEGVSPVQSTLRPRVERVEYSLFFMGRYCCSDRQPGRMKAGLFSAP